jgi:F-type H+-transporting ATPase subunit beta
VTLAWVPTSSASDPGGPEAAVAGSFHAALLLSPGLTVRGIYPAVDGLRATSTALAAADVGGDHVEVWRRYREALGRTRELMADVAFWELVALKSRRANERFQAFEADRLARLAAGDRQLVTRVRKVERYFTQPFHIAEPFTGMPGQTVSRHETVRTVAAILDGRFDHVPDQALTYKGSVQP